MRIPALAALLVGSMVAGAAAQAPALTVQMIGNAGVLLTDGATSLLIDLPYESGAFGYMSYDPAALQPAGDVVSVITHHHRDHFDAGLFRARTSWRIIGPPSVTGELPAERVLAGDSLTVGAFSVVVVPTPHTSDHRSYRIRWQGRVLYAVGDTEDPSALLTQRDLDVLFITTWLSCAVDRVQRALPSERVLLYHHRLRDRACGPVETLPQGASFTLFPVR